MAFCFFHLLIMPHPAYNWKLSFPAHMTTRDHLPKYPSPCHSPIGLLLSLCPMLALLHHRIRCFPYCYSHPPNLTISYVKSFNPKTVTCPYFTWHSGTFYSCTSQQGWRLCWRLFSRVLPSTLHISVLYLLIQLFLTHFSFHFNHLIKFFFFKVYWRSTLLASQTWFQLNFKLDLVLND